MRFQSKFPFYKIILKPTEKQVVDGKLFIKPAIKVAFRNGVFSTNDEKLIKLLREACKKNKRIWEIDEQKIENARNFLKEVNEVKKKYAGMDKNLLSLAEEKKAKEVIRGARGGDIQKAKVIRNNEEQ